MEYKDYYKILNVDKKASEAEIKQAYRRLARKFHPDVSKEKNAEEQFKNVKEAYEVLKDPAKRQAYDQLGSNWQAGQEFRPPPGWEGGNFRYSSGEPGDFSYEDLGGGGFSDFFSQLFGGGRSRTRKAQSGFQGHQHQGGAFDFQEFQQRGRDQHAKVNLSLEEAFRGGSKTIHLQIPEMDSSGRIQHKTRTLKITIPAGATTGQQLRLTGQGEPGINGGPAGDLYVELHLEPHHLFSVQGKDIYLTLPVTPWEAALGAQIKVPTLGGSVDLKLQPGSQTGQKLRLKGRGLPSKHTPGDQYAIVQILTPPAQTDAQRQVYQNMATILPFNPRAGWS